MVLAKCGPYRYTSLGLGGGVVGGCGCVSIPGGVVQVSERSVIASGVCKRMCDPDS